MLCLTAKEGGYLMIGDDIKIMFLRPKASGQLHIGISAPKSVPIRRDKVFEQELRECAGDSKRTPAEIFKAMETLQANKKERKNAQTEAHRRAEKQSYDERTHQEREAAQSQSAAAQEQSEAPEPTR